MEFGVAFLLGLGGSLHCVGMCGPLALALPGGRTRAWDFLRGRLLYNLGRTATYALLGGFFGWVGGALGLAGWQRALSVGLGAGLLVAGVLWWIRRTPLALQWPAVPGLARLQGALGRLLRREGRGGLLSIGLLNGLLPCGMVYLGLMGSLATGGLLRGMAYMAFFGAGTWPLMLATSLVGRALRPERRRPLQRMAPMGLALVGALLVLRGLALDIPFVSPPLQAGTGHHH